ncbi:MAG: hypothetical protein RL654_133 [Pseudomonadota bacterium]|jgi:hypothetical protein
MTTATTTVTPRRVYVVRDNTNGKTRLVRAINVAAALRHVVRIAYAVDVATQDDLIELLTSGVAVEDASAAEDEQPQGARPRQRRAPQAAEAPPEADRDPRVPDMFEAKAAPAEPAAAPTAAADQAAAPAAVEEVAAEQPGEPVPALQPSTPAAAPATPAPTPPTAKAVAADAPANTASAPNPAAASAAAEPQGSTAADDLEDRVRALGARLGTEQPRLPPDHLPLELLTLCGVENPRPGDVLPWQLDGLAQDFWDAYYEARGRTPGRVPVKYRDKETGSTWTGRGLKPKWLQAALEAGRTLSEFEVSEA